MIVLIRRETDRLADELQEELREMLIAHRIEIVASGHPDRFPRLPVLVEGEEVVSGEKALRLRIKTLRHVMRHWDRFTGDSCFVNEDGETC